MIRCDICGSEFEESEVVDNKCPICGESLNTVNSLMGADRVEVNIKEKEDEPLENEDVSKKMIEMGLTASKFSRLVENGNKLPEEESENEDEPLEETENTEENKEETDKNDLDDFDEVETVGEIEDDNDDELLENSGETSEILEDASDLETSGIEIDTTGINDETSENLEETAESKEDNSKESDIDEELERLRNVELVDTDDLEIEPDIEPKETKKEKNESELDSIEQSLLEDEPKEKKKFSFKDINLRSLRFNLRINKKILTILGIVTMLIIIGSVLISMIYINGAFGDFGQIPKSI